MCACAMARSGWPEISITNPASNVTAIKIDLAVAIFIGHNVPCAWNVVQMAMHVA